MEGAVKDHVLQLCVCVCVYGLIYTYGYILGEEVAGKIMYTNVVTLCLYLC